MLNDNKTNPESQTVQFSVYVLWCRVTGKFYVGVTHRKVETRIRQHKHSGRQFIGREIQRIGWESNWDYWVVEESVPSELISERERYWIKFFDSRYPDGYNKTSGGIKHFKHNEEVKDKIKNKLTGIKRAPFTDEHKANISKSLSGEKNPRYEKHHTPETKETIRQANLGRKHTEEEKAKMREADRGRKSSMKGKRHTEESKAKMRQAHLGNSSRKGIPCSEETKAKIREKALAKNMNGENNPFYGKKHTEETKALMREKVLARHAAKRAAKAVAEENLAAANSTPTSLSTLLDAVIFQ